MKKFSSIFSEEIREYIDLKRSMGFKLAGIEMNLGALDRFFKDAGIDEKKLSKKVVDSWCQKRSYESNRNQHFRISLLRGLTLFLKESGYETYVPPKGMGRSNRTQYAAHIYSRDELKRCFEAIDELPSLPTKCPYRHLVLPLYFRILYSTGMRLSELRLAKVRDFNLRDGYITIHGGKNNKDRIVPLHPKLLSRCEDLKKELHQESSSDEFFLFYRPGVPMSALYLYGNFRRALEKAGIPHTGKGPRIHDFRHTYCVRLLEKWVKEKKDLLAWLPYMRTALGHESFYQTAYYLKLTSSMFPEIQRNLKEAFPNIIEELSSEGNHADFY